MTKSRPDDSVTYRRPLYHKDEAADDRQAVEWFDILKEREEDADNKEASDPVYELGTVLCVELMDDVDAVEYIDTLLELGVDVGGSELQIVALV